VDFTADSGVKRSPRSLADAATVFREVRGIDDQLFFVPGPIESPIHSAGSPGADARVIRTIARRGSSR
jgi:hypothetical protein